MVITRTASLALAIVSVLALVPSASAQINPFARGGSGITNDDAKYIEQASSKLYKTDSPVVGASEKWSNPGTGNSGTVTLTQIYEKDGMPCRKLRHRISIKGQKDPQVYIFSRCRVKSGEWKLL